PRRPLSNWVEGVEREPASAVVCRGARRKRRRHRSTAIRFLFVSNPPPSGGSPIRKDRQRCRHDLLHILQSIDRRVWLAVQIAQITPRCSGEGSASASTATRRPTSRRTA